MSEYDSAGRPIYRKKNKTVKKAPAKKQEKKTDKGTLVNTKDKDRPTVEVKLPEVNKEIPEVLQIVEAKVIADKIDETSDKPQAVIVLEDATYEVSDDVELVPVHTEDADIIVAVDPKTRKDLEAASVDVQLDVAAALKDNKLKKAKPKATAKRQSSRKKKSELVSLPDKDGHESVIEVPIEIEHIVKLDVIDNSLVLVPVDDIIDEGNLIIPIITKDDEDDIVVIVPPDVKAWCDHHDIDIEKDVSFAVIEAQTEVYSYKKVVINEKD